ncbi:MAG: hypothetical protein ABI430_02045 [Candidatus Taylorbacteria bacterium]
MSTKKITIIIGVLIALLLVFIGYKYLNKGTPSTSDALEQSGQPQTLVGKDIIAELQTVNSITMSDTIFRTKTFLSLQDFSRKVTAEPQGRSNPFAPIGVGNLSQPISTSTQTR